MIEPGQIRPCSKCKTSFQPKPYQIKSGNYLCRDCQNSQQKEYMRRRKERGVLTVAQPGREEIGGGQGAVKNRIELPLVELPGEAETKRTREVLAKYGLEIDEAALVAARAVKAGYPVKNLSGYMGRDYLLFCVMSDMMHTKNAALRMRYLEMAGQLTGVISNGAPAPGGVQITQVSFNEIGIKPGNGTSLAGQKPSEMLEAETVQQEAP